MADTARAQELKAEGNALFGNGEWAAALNKYAEAIQLDDRNAVLYANRAACAIHLGNFAEAKADAQKAVTLDPKYTKAWGRLASACNGLLEYQESAEFWRKALATFPSENLTQAEQQQKRHCEDELKIALSRLSLTEEDQLIPVGRELQVLMPWNRVKTMEAELKAGLPGSAMSSAWVMLRASKLWDSAAEGMTHISETVTPTGTLYGGCLGVVGRICDAVLTDQRVFRIEGPDWVDQYHKQVTFESTKAGAWITHTPQAVKEHALELQQQMGWHVVRPAIDITVRAWIMRAFSANRPGGSPHLSLAEYDSALDILNWGRTGPWKDVPSRDKGVVFEDYFVRAVRRLRLDTLMSVVGKVGGHGSEDMWKRLQQEAQSIVDEMPKVGKAALSPGEHEPGFVLAYGVYPKATALTMLGLHAHHIGRLCLARGEYDDAVDHIVRSYAMYYRGAKLFPPDDEKHAWFIAIALQLVLIAGGPIEVILGAAEEHCASYEQSQRLWGHSLFVPVTDKNDANKVVRQLEERLKKDLATGKYKPGDLIPPNYLAGAD